MVRLFTASVVVGVAALIAPVILLYVLMQFAIEDWPRVPVFIIFCSMILGAMGWGFLLRLALNAQGRRGLWLLVTLPLALGWPGYLALSLLRLI